MGLAPGLGQHLDPGVAAANPFRDVLQGVEACRDLDIRTAVLYPVEGLSDETRDEDYLSLMRANLAALQKANDC